MIIFVGAALVIMGLTGLAGKSFSAGRRFYFAARLSYRVERDKRKQ